VDDPGLIIACADFLAQTGKWNHAAEFLKADLRQGIVVRPWVYKSLAIALRQSGGAADEIERAEMSSAELEPLDAQGYLDASRAMAGDKRWDRALAFAKQASVLEPNTPYAYNEALLYAESANDAAGMEWAASHLLRQDWPVGNKELQSKAIHEADELVRKLERENRQADAAKLKDAVKSQQQRDLVFKLSWQGDADLDLKVKEPTGSVCWVLNRQTIGGGTMTGDAQSDRNSETYQAAKAFPGDYEVTVDRVWGAPLSNKAQLKIIRHQGTPQQSEELMTIDLKNSGAVKVNLTEGRRTEVAYVPPPSSVRPVNEAVIKTTDRCSLMNKLRKMSEPDVQGVTVGLHGSTVGMGETTAAPAPASVTPMGGEQYQSKLSSFIANSLEVTTQATMAADRRSVRVSMTPVFNTVTDAKPVVSYSGIPGSHEP
jgi:tetratricopeptide (TPR) repeat protein